MDIKYNWSKQFLNLAKIANTNGIKTIQTFLNNEDHHVLIL